MSQEAFVIMQIGDTDLDQVYEEAIAPAVMDAGLEPVRIDQDNKGGLLNAEIMAAIEDSEVIVAELSNERPNCYLEVGYAMGLGRNQSLVLTVREDHLPGHPEYVVGGPKVHFDLAGYDLLLWDPADLPRFRHQLTQRILRRMALAAPAGRELIGGDVADEEWTAELRTQGLAEIVAGAGPGYLEIAFGLVGPRLHATQRELLDAARASTVNTFGWPIGVVIDQPDSRPRPTGSGIHAEVVFDRGSSDRSFDLWDIRTNGDFYTILSLFEDQQQRTDELFFNTRIVRVAEAFLYCARLYGNLGVSREGVVRMTIRHGGLRDRTLTSSTPRRHLAMPYVSTANLSETSLDFSLGEVGGDLTGLVRRVTDPLFELFDFFQPSEEAYDDIVDRFVRGEVT